MRVLMTILCLSLAPVAAANEYVFVTENYPPFNYRENGSYRGSSVEQIELLMKDAGLAYRIEMRPWARALARAETEPKTCIFTTVHTVERHERFKWVEPLLTGRTVLVRKAGTDIRPTTIDEARQYIVGTQRDDFTADLLVQLKFAKIDLASDFNLTLKKLLNGRIELLPVSERHYHKLRRENVAVESVLVLTDSVYAIACNLSVADSDIDRMRTSLQKLIADGTQAALLKKYGLDDAAN